MVDMQTVENERKEEKIMDSLQTKSAGRLSRVEAVTDPEVNRTLFEMYSSLVNPMVNIEKTLDDISETKSILIANEGDLSITLSEIVSRAVHLFPKMFLLVFIVIFVLAHFIEPLDMDILPALVVIAVIAAVLSFVWRYIQDNHSIAARNKARKDTCNKMADKLCNLNDSLENQINRIGNLLQFVPPKYRSSNALNYFVESYQNSRVDNLKEAVNAYDTYYFRKQTVQIQEQILEQEQRNAQAFERIEYHQLCMMNQLDGIRNDIGWY